MAKIDYKDILIRFKNGEIDYKKVDDLLADAEKETRGRRKKILLENPDLAELKKEVDKANRAWVARALWLRMERHKHLAKSEKKIIINKSAYCTRVTSKVLENEITIANKLNSLDGFVIKIGFDSVVIGTEKDFDIAGFSNIFMGNPLAAFYGIDTGVKVPASIETIKVFVSRSIFMKFRPDDLGV